MQPEPTKATVRRSLATLLRRAAQASGGPQLRRPVGMGGAARGKKVQRAGSAKTRRHEHALGGNRCEVVSKEFVLHNNHAQQTRDASCTGKRPETSHIISSHSLGRGSAVAKLSARRACRTQNFLALLMQRCDARRELGVELRDRGGRGLRILHEHVRLELRLQLVNEFVEALTVGCGERDQRQTQQG